MNTSVKSLSLRVTSTLHEGDFSYNGDGEGKLPFHIEYKENEIILSANFMIFDVKSAGGNTCLLNVVTHRGLGACIALPNKEADAVLAERVLKGMKGHYLGTVNVRTFQGKIAMERQWCA